MNVFDLAAKLTLDSSEYEKGLTNAQKNAKSFGNSLKTAMKVGGAAIATVGTATVALTGTVVKNVAATAEYGDAIDKASQKMGISAQAYQEWDAILQHSGTSIDSLQSGMRALTNALVTGDEAFEQLGLSQEALANMSMEDAFAATITALQNMDDETQRTYLASQLLGRGAMELGALLNTSAEDTEAMRQRVHELNGVMGDEAVRSAAAYEDSLQDMQTAFSGLSRNMLAKFMPSLTTVMDGLTGIFSGDSEGGLALISEGISGITAQITEAMPQILEVGSSIVLSLSQAIVENLPKLLSAGADAVMALADGIVKQLPTIAKTGLEIIVSLARSIADNLPEIIPTIIDVILEIVDTLTDPENLSNLVDAAIEIITALAEGLIDAVPKLIEKVPDIILNLVTAIIDNLPKILEAATEIMVSLAEGLIDAIPKLIEAVPEIIMQLLTALVENIPKLLEASTEIIITLVEGLINALPKLIEQAPQIILSIIMAIVDNLPKLFEASLEIIFALIEGLFKAIPELVKSIPKLIEAIIKGFVNGLKSFWEIGKRIVEGLWEGIKSTFEWIKEKISGFFTGIIDGILGLLGIHSPSRVFAGIGKNMALGLGEGFDKAIVGVEKDIDSHFDFGTKAMEIQAVPADIDYSSERGYGDTIINVTVDPKNLKDMNDFFDMITNAKRLGRMYA